MNKKGFTLIELIVSLALLSIVLVFMFNLLVILKGEEKVSALDMKLAVNQSIISKHINNDIISNKQIKNVSCTSISCDITFNNGINKNIILSNDNKTISYGTADEYEFTRTLPDDLVYENINIVNESGLYKINIYVSNNIEFNIELISYSGLVTNIDTSGANPPVLAKDSSNNDVMIPVYYDETCNSNEGCWRKADKNDQTLWYNYSASIWANAVTVTSTNRETLISDVLTPVGSEIPMEDINTMWVWIPRYEYYINGSYAGGSVGAPGAIEINFKSGTSTAVTNGNYRIHPVFRNGTINKTLSNYDLGGWDKEITGYWIGKFETTGTNETEITCATTTCIVDITIKPDMINKIGTVSSLYNISRSMSGNTTNPYGFGSTVESHMMKSDEWGGVAYLSQSIYGRCNDVSCGDIYKNDSQTSTYHSYTGRSSGTESVSSNNTVYGTYSYDGYSINQSTGIKEGPRDLSKIARTTGNIYGVYDMAGGGWEATMSNYNGTTGDSGFASSWFTTTGNNKYWNKYTTQTITSGCNGICYGQALSETSGWYNETTNFVVDSPWLIRGGDNSSSNAGLFNTNRNNGFAAAAFRVIITP